MQSDTEPTPSEDSWLTAAKRLQAIASTGLHFGESEFDKERYEDIYQIATTMLSQLGQVPLTVIKDLLGAPGAQYETPKVDVRGAVFQQNKILLVQEKLDGLWTLPGGYADVCISPAENVVKEIFEEANLNVTAKHLYALIHKARHEYDMDVRDFYKLFFICELEPDFAQGVPGHQQPKPGSETLDAQFFSLDELPPLSTGRIIEKHILLAVEYRDNPNIPPVFD